MFCTSSCSTTTREPKPTKPGWLPRWTPTSDVELHEAEAAILNPIRPMISQKTVAGLNTICSIHEKVSNSGKHVDQPYRAIPNQQQTQLKPLKKDKYTSIICVHGFGGGLANFLPIWKPLAEEFDIYAIDLPGFARSERPKVNLNSPQDALDWFLNRMLAWFTEMSLGLDLPDCPTAPSNAMDSDDELRPTNRNKKSEASKGEKNGLRAPGCKVVLLGHSFGGYLCAMFAAKYPNLIDHAILADPWGMGRAVPPTKEANPNEYAFRKSFKFTFGTWVFNNLGAGGVLSLTGPWGKGLLPKLRPDFGETWAKHLDDPMHFYEYTYHCNANGDRVGERAFVKLGPLDTYLCILDQAKSFTTKKGAAVEEPLPTVPEQLGAAAEAEPSSRLSKVSFLYGSHSWMYARGQNDAKKFIDALNNDSTVHATMHIIQRAGHQLISDQPTQVADKVLSLLD